MLRHTHHDPFRTPFALDLAAVILFCVGAASTLMLVSTPGQVHVADMFTGPIGLNQNGMGNLRLCTVQRANRLVGSMDNGYGGNSTFNRDFDQMMVQITDTVRSVRIPADLLARHPEALIRGRDGATQ